MKQRGSHDLFRAVHWRAVLVGKKSLFPHHKRNLLTQSWLAVEVSGDGQDMFPARRLWVYRLRVRHLHRHVPGTNKTESGTAVVSSTDLSGGGFTCCHVTLAFMSCHYFHSGGAYANNLKVELKQPPEELIQRFSLQKHCNASSPLTNFYSGKFI